MGACRREGHRKTYMQVTAFDSEVSYIVMDHSHVITALLKSAMISVLWCQLPFCDIIKSIMF